MTEKATVIRIDSKIVTLSCGDKESCAGCAGSTFCNVKGNSFKALNNQDIEIGIGDRVNFYLPGGRTVFAGFLVLILPLLMFMLFFMSAGWFFGISSEGIKTLFGFGGLGAGFGLSLLYNRIRRHKDMPLIVSAAVKSGSGD